MVFSKIGHIQYIRGLFNILRLAGPLCGMPQRGGAAHIGQEKLISFKNLKNHFLTIKMGRYVLIRLS